MPRICGSASSSEEHYITFREKSKGQNGFCEKSEEKRPRDGDDQRGQIVGDLDLLAEDEVDADAEDQHIAHQREAGERSVRHQRADKGGEDGHQALPDGHRDHGEHSALAHGGGQRHDDDAVEDALGGQDGVVVIQRVVHRADDRHGADADGEGGGGEAVDEAGIPLGMALDLQPLTEALEIILDAQDFADQAAEAHGDDEHHFARGGQRAVCDGEHVLERAARADENRADTTGLDHDILIALFERLAEEEAQKAAQQHECGVDDCTHSDHVYTPHFDEKRMDIL